MAIYNENYLIELFGMNKKNNKNKYEKRKNEDKTSKDKSNQSSSPRLIDFSQEDIKQIGSTLRKIINEINKDPNIKKDVLKQLELDEEYDGESKYIPFICKLSKNNGYELIYIVCSADQDYRYAISDFIVDIVEKLEDSIYEYEKTLEDSYFWCGIGEEDDGMIIIKKYRKNK